MPDLRVILHIGGAKCGSSAIQAYLAKNAGVLAERGVGVPGRALRFGEDVTGEQIWYFEELASKGENASLVEAIRGMCREAVAQGLSTVVVSAENLCNHGRLADIFAKALEGHDVQVVFYVRRQDDFLISSWQQWNLKRFASMEAFLDARAGRDARWYSMILPWAEYFGDERVKVRPFVRNRLRNGDVVDDFFAVAGLSQTGLVGLERDANPSFDEALARLAHRVRDVFDSPHDNRFYDVMARLLGEAALKNGRGSCLFDLDTRRHILALYSNENAALADRFVRGIGDEHLFPPPDATDVIEKSEADRLSDEIAMLTRAIYALATRLEGLER